MVRCNLSILLAEQGIKITTVAKETGISRTTLTALANNRSTGIQLDTINTLCSYLRVGPDRLIGFIPSEIKIVRIAWNDETPLTKLDDGTIQYLETIAFETSLSWDSPSEICNTQVLVTARRESESENGYDILTAKLDISPSSDTERVTETESLRRFLDTLPRAFLSAVEEEIAYTHASISVPLKQLPSGFDSIKLRYKINWSESLVSHHTEYRPMTPEEMNKLYPH